MHFSTYMLHCADRSFYVGHTDDLEKRMGQHEQGLIPGYTSERLPVKLVWAQDFATREEAREAEAQLKGWSRAKKLALIRGDWVSVSALARSKEGASTSSAKSVFSAERHLHPHLDQLPSEPLSLAVITRAGHGRLAFRYRLTGPLDHITVPQRSPPARSDELWLHTCFEAFIELDGGPAYIELNFSPSGEWAAYHFTGYRAGMSRIEVDPPRMRCVRGRYALDLVAAVRMPRPSAATRLALSAVIEDIAGRKSYWALAHPAAKPDFHHPNGFILQFPERS